jgi:protein-S-isoprenylcysteine O-methyltransferase Ste14
MARPAFKRAWTRIIPEPAERSTYVLCSSLALAGMFWLWQPLGGVIWDFEATWARCTLWTLFLAGWALILFSSFLINHFDLFGLRQVWLHWRGTAYTALPFRTPSLYRVVRHPLYVGWLLAFWATPTMTIAHLLFALLCTAYILAAIPLEERDLVEALPEYAAYREAVPMLLPRAARAPSIHREHLA